MGVNLQKIHQCVLMEIKCGFHCLVFTIIATLVILGIYDSVENFRPFLLLHHQKILDKFNLSLIKPPSLQLPAPPSLKLPAPPPSLKPAAPPSQQPSPPPAYISTSSCNFFSGKWVFDNQSYPLYKDYKCPFMFDDLACEKYGRKDLSYQQWRWQPHDCDLPRFDGKLLLERLRGKRLVFVGDSLNRNQWVSMICLLDTSIPSGIKSMKLTNNLYTFKAEEYNARVDFYWAPLLVESNGDDPSSHRLPNRVVRIESIEKHAKNWTDSDILVINSYLWWKSAPVTAVWGSMEHPRRTKPMNYRNCYEAALKTLSDWLETHVNRTKTKLFFVSMSPTHSKGEDWGKPTGQSCLNETRMISKEGYSGSGSDPGMMKILESTVKRLKSRNLDVRLLNITQLSEYRKDGHPSIYRKIWTPLRKEQIGNPLSYADCTHWCLPGVPDVWNQLLYAYILDS